MKRSTSYLVATCLLALAGCGSSPSVRYFGLETIGYRVARDAEGSPIMAVGAFRMPEYLNRSQFVTRGAGAEIVVDEFSRWAEPLDDAIHRVLASNLDVLLESVVVVAFPSSVAVNTDYRLTGRFDRFAADQDGRVVLEVQWGLRDAAGTVRLLPRRVRFESQAARPKDPGSIAQAMSDALGQLCRDIAAEIEAIELNGST